MLRKIKNFIKNSHLYRVIKFGREPIVLTDHYGIRFVLYPWDRMNIDKHIHRYNYIAEFEAMKLLVRPGQIVFDIGANIGLHSVLSSRLVGSKGKVFSFEPVPETKALLMETLALNRLENVHVYDMAISDTEGSMKMNIFDAAHSVWNSLGKPEYGTIKPSTEIQIQTTTLDAFCAKHDIKHIDYMKIDIEGYEKFAFDGARGLLSAGNIDTIAFEISEMPLKGSGVQSKDVFEALQKYSYKIFGFDARAKQFFGPITDTNSSYDNYFASRSDLTNIQK